MIEPPFPVEELDRLVGYLRRRYLVVRASDLLHEARTRRAGGPVPVALTFDDDLASHAEAAAPVLRRHGAVGTAFLCGATSPFWWQLLQGAVDDATLAPDHLPEVDGQAVRDAVAGRPGAIRRLAWLVENLTPQQRDRMTAALRALAPATPPLLGPGQRQHLKDLGWEIGFHTGRHDPLPQLPEAELRHAVVDDGIRHSGSAFAYPHGKATGREAQAVRAAGYTVAFTGAWGAVHAGTDPHLVPRVQPSWASPGRTVLALARALA
jgi:peptidoglycan/xylan/chitin deacetylase (PgdA/CDA1 family)